ncbi:DUF305 domain-containing protein [Sinomonas sp. G460-2]|uniref:DUF305 domain-containing protein n=1 Tax=Sinomonas sp. G460-2 TaxID=3393464 RepID=UPI0039EE8835
MTGLTAAALALAGCGAPGSAPSSTAQAPDHSGHAMPMSTASGSATASAPATAPASAAFNAADAMFAQMMIPHHEQAVSMSETVLAKPGLDARVAALAVRIKAAQAPEIATLKGWLTAWEQPTAMPTSSSSSTGSTGSAGAGHSMEGMMSSGDLDQLAPADAPTASKLFLSQMVAHHEGAVRMAQTEKSAGRNADAVAMAASIVDSQTQEIAEMKVLLAGM